MKISKRKQRKLDEAKRLEEIASKRLEEEKRTAKRLEEIKAEQKRKAAERSVGASLLKIEEQYNLHIRKYAALKPENNRAVNEVMVKSIAHIRKLKTATELYKVNYEVTMSTAEVTKAYFSIIAALNELSGQQQNQITTEDIIKMQDRITIEQSKATEAAQAATHAMEAINPASDYAVTKEEEAEIEMLVLAEMEKNGSIIDISDLEQKMATGRAKFS